MALLNETRLHFGYRLFQPHGSETVIESVDTPKIIITLQEQAISSLVVISSLAASLILSLI